MINALSPDLVPTGEGQGRSICYSGYRAGQHPGKGLFPSYSNIAEDLHLLAPHWQCIRLYDAGPHALTVLEVIKREALPMKVLLGMDLAAEVNNPECPWFTPLGDEQLSRNVQHNDDELVRVRRLLDEYAEFCAGVSIGNEASVSWTDHKVPFERLLHFAGTLKTHTDAPVTFCENYVPWTTGELDALANTIDVIALHSYPIWESIHLQDALAYTQHNYQSVKSRYPNKPVIITEAGWTTKANGRGFTAHTASVENQSIYCRELLNWSQQHGIQTFLFEAFDEAWKGSDDPAEPEKHWGIHTLDRSAKPVVLEVFTKSFIDYPAK